MRLTVIGSSGSMSGPASPSSCYLVEAEGPGSDGESRTWRVVLDLGSGAIGALMRHIDPGVIDALALSHLHADHMVDVTGLQVILRYHPEGQRGPVRLLAPVGAEARVRELVLAEPGESLAADFAFEEWELGAPVSVGPLTLEPFAALHPIPAFGIRVSGPREDGTGAAVIAYTGDTDLCDGERAMASGADLLLSEAPFQEGRDTVRGIHLTGLRAGQLAASGGVGRLILTHLQPWTDADVVAGEAASAYDGPIDVAAPGRAWAL